MRSSITFSRHKFRISIIAKNSIVKHKKSCFHHHNFSTSSKPTTNLNTYKEALLNKTKAVKENFWSTLIKSVTISSSILKPSISSVFRAKEQFTQNKNVKENFILKSKEIDSIDDRNGNVSNNLTEKQQSRSVSPSPKQSGKTSSFEQTILEWFAGGNLQDKRKEFLNKNVTKDEKKLEKGAKSAISKLSLEQRSRFLVQSFNLATSPTSQFLRLEEICKHIINFPQQKNVLIKEGLLRSVLWLKHRTSDEAVKSQARVVLSLLGHHEPPLKNGIRILSIDGGGIRGLIAIEILRQLETRTNKKVHQLFDYICGVSSGAILTVLLGCLRLSLDECEKLYVELSSEVFKQSAFWGTGRLMWSHAYYDTTMWVKMLKVVFGEKYLVDATKQEFSPKVAAVSTVMNLSSLQAFIFRNYNYPFHVHSHYLGSCSYKMWEAVRASGAAPGYFEEYSLDEYLHQDGGVMINNPSALAVHETNLLWPSETIQCLFSIGNGRYIPAMAEKSCTSTSLKTKILKVIDSATDTEGVHVILNDLLLPNTYFRFNPYLTEFLSLDEIRSEKHQQLKLDTQMYLRRNEHKFQHAIYALTKPRNTMKKINDWLQFQKKLFL